MCLFGVKGHPTLRLASVAPHCIYARDSRELGRKAVRVS